MAGERPTAQTHSVDKKSDTVLRSIKSFVKREGRMTPGQKRALEKLWPSYGINLCSKRIDIETVFEHPGPTILEIGFGMGEAITKMAADNPADNFLGIEVHRPGVGRLLATADTLKLNNLRIICADAVDVLKDHLTDNSLYRIQIFFPDPWHKKKHHKRRLIQADFVALMGQKIKPGGYLHIATDWHHYAEHIVRIMQTCQGFENVADEKLFVKRPSYRPLTRFEQRGRRLGHGVWDMLFQKVGGS
ncbi:MAG: tRNA (guanosine(46)-N7)-methyltransferase TrmB [Thiohalomonadales bacterium]